MKREILAADRNESHMDDERREKKTSIKMDIDQVFWINLTIESNESSSK